MNNRDVEITGSFNSRDLGGYSTPLGPLAWRKVLRSGNLAYLQPAGKQVLKQLAVSRVIDLRSQKERAAEPDSFTPNDGIELISISLFDDLDPSQLGGSNRLLSLYQQALQTQGEKFVQIIRLISSSANAALFHCTAGKDRTGLVSALLLAVVGVSDDDIVADYALTAERMGPLLARFATTAQALELNKADIDALLACHPQTMRATLAWLAEHYQSAQGYLQAHGFTDADTAALQAFMGLR